MSSFFLFFPFLLIFCTLSPSAHGQDPHSISLSQAFTIALANNKDIEKARIQQDIAGTAVKEIQDLRLPDIDFHASYQRISNLAEFKNGLGNKVTTRTIPDIASLASQRRINPLMLSPGGEQQTHYGTRGHWPGGCYHPG